MSDKEKLAGLFADIAQWLELKGENPFKIRAYEAAARIFEQLDADPALLARAGQLEEIPGVGKAIAAKALEFIETGRMVYHDELKASIPAVLFEMVKIPGLGAKKALALHEKLGVQSIGELEYACRENRLLELPGFGAKTQAKILAGIESLRRFQGRYLISDALPAAGDIIARLGRMPGVARISTAGSIRRHKETVGDIDIVVGATESTPVMQAVTELPGVVSVIAHGPTKTSITLQNGLNVDVRLVSVEEYPCALHHFTGSREHNIILRGMAKDLGLKINEYGVERRDGSRVAIEDEEGLYHLLGMDYIEPELREGGEEIQAALEKRLPVLVRQDQICGAFHIHTTWSDGRATVAQMAAAAQKMGWSYLGITDHSRTAFYAGGLKNDAVLGQRREIDAYNALHPEFRIFAGIESDILPDGSLDYPDEVLSGFDFVIGSVHSSFGMGEAAMTQRIIKAMNSPYMTMLGHPTGRLLLAREGYEVDLNAIIQQAGKTGTIIEINASPYRLDLDWRWVRQAKEAGVLLAVNPDAHSTEELAVMAYGIGIARKGWLEKDNILNTRDMTGVVDLLSRTRLKQSCRSAGKSGNSRERYIISSSPQERLPLSNRRDQPLLSDIEIAQAATMKPIGEIASSLGIAGKYVENYGHYKAKISLDLWKEIGQRTDGKLILVTAITPTPAGEGKTTTTIGVGQALVKLGKKAIIMLREPSLGPCMGVKGGAAGGGYSQVVPMEDINLHFTGDFHAVSTAHALLSAALDNHLQQGNLLGIDPRRIVWRRAVDMNDRALRNIIVGLGGKAHGVPREDGFDITVASEVMAVLCLSKDIADLKERLSKIVIGYTYAGEPVTAGMLKVHGAMAALLKEAIKPNLVQTLENVPAIIHGGPFANIAHGCNSLSATRMGLKLADYAVTEAGFGADLGAEKFLDIKCRMGGLQPAAVVLVATVRALKMHGGVPKSELGAENVSAVVRGAGNLEKHIENMQKYGLPIVVAVNLFPTDTQAEMEAVLDICARHGVPAAASRVFSDGGEGGIAVAEKLLALLEEEREPYRPLYPLEMPLKEKVRTIAREIYGAEDALFTKEAEQSIEKLTAMGYGNLPVCMAKTQYSLSDDASLLGRPQGFSITVRQAKVSAGAGFVVMLTGEIMTMPGLPKVPAAEKIDIDNEGRISGLF